jgi:ADP-ribose pyrophosphatase YjhB (NUDIX family)/DNA-directed RNA polymerase subunit RPC12/RpoP
MTLEHLRKSPASLFHYCPRCGTEEPRTEGSRALRCERCGFLFFFNSAAAAGAFIFHRGQLILCVRAKEPAQGMLDVPGGFIDFDETVEEGLRREIREELHIETSDFRYLLSAPNDYTYAGVPYKTTDLFFVCEAPDISGIRAADDVADYLLIAPDELDPARLAFVSTRAAFAVLRDELERGRQAAKVR